MSSPVDTARWERLEKIARERECRCGQSLFTAMRNGDIELVCDTCGVITDTVGLPKRGARWIQKKKESWYGKMETTALMAMNESQMLARIGMAKFPTELTQVDRKMLAQAAISYGFDPLMGEISVYQGRPYVSIDGRYRKAQETGRLSGVESRPAKKGEREDWGIPEGDYFFRAEVYVKDVDRPFVGWGRVFAAETTGGKGFKPVEKNPQRMAEKRAEAQALRKAFSIPLPSLEDIGLPEDEPVRAVPLVVKDIPIVADKETGEIKEPIEGTPEPARDIAYPRDPETVKDLATLQSAAFRDFQLQPADLKKLFGVKSMAELTDTPPVLYRRIVEAQSPAKV